MNNIKHDIAILIRESQIYDTLMLYKGKNDIMFLKEFNGIIDGQSSDNEPVTLEHRLDQCEKCAGASRKKYPFGSGANGLFIILNSPRLLTETEIKIFRDDSIRLLKKMIAAMDLNFEECYITNLIKCDHGSPLLKPSQMIDHCMEFIGEEIELIHPKVILVMGDLMPLQDIVHEKNDFSWYSINHPITLLKNHDMKSEAWNTMKIVMDVLRNKK